MNSNLKMFLDFVASHPGARGDLIFILFCVFLSPRKTAAVLAVFVIIHMLWIGP
jgi:hypothetical protein